MKLVFACASVGWVLAWGTPLAAQSPDPPSLNQACPPSTCGANCSNTPFVPTDCMTTPYGPARANVVLGNPLTSPNMLWCPGGRPYALCFFSGPPYATGNAGNGNKTLSCVLDPSTGIANCACQVYNSGSYYVDVNSILNRGAWYETRYVCGADGSRCKNMRDCDTNGQTKAGSAFACPVQVAPVCSYINSQGSGSASSWFYPQAGTADLVSTFSFRMSPPPPPAAPYTLGQTCCTGVYAGCMTAACKYPAGVSSLPDGNVVNCACPTWTGAYQIGQNQQTCQLTYPGLSYVWSAANSVTVTEQGTSCQPSPSTTK
jgi:hypothetical protein